MSHISEPLLSDDQADNLVIVSSHETTYSTSWTGITRMMTRTHAELYTCSDEVFDDLVEKYAIYQRGIGREKDDMRHDALFEHVFTELMRELAVGSGESHGLVPVTGPGPVRCGSVLSLVLPGAVDEC